MCFHGWKKSLEAGDSGAAMGADFAGDEMEPGVMRVICKNPIRTGYLGRD